MKRASFVIAVLCFALAAKRDRPQIGTQFHPLPSGKAKALVETSCYPCHSADLLVQQRLTEKQWTAEVKKMIRWGAKVNEKDKAAIVAYLSGNFGPQNTRFVPIRTKAVDGRR